MRGPHVTALLLVMANRVVVKPDCCTDSFIMNSAKLCQYVGLSAAS